MAWLALIEETDPVAIAEVLRLCQADEGARRFFVERAMANLPAGFDLEWFEERAAIREYDGGYSRQEAERLAYLDVSKMIH